MSNISSFQNYDYTNLDYSELLAALTESFSADEDSPLKDFDFEGANIQALMRMLTYYSHLSSFHTSIALNEMYFSTSRHRKNLLKSLPGYGYTPRRNTPAQKYLNIKNISEINKTIPAFTQFNAIDDLGETKMFFTLESYNLDPNDIELIKVYQSSVVKTETDITIKTTNGIVTPILLEIPDLSETYFQVETVESGSVVNWVQYENLDSMQNELNLLDLSLLPEQDIYFLDEKEKGYLLSFSETSIGRLPNPDSGNTIQIKYLTSDGSASNGISTASFTFNVASTSLSILQDQEIGESLDTSSTSSSSGGQDKETLQELKENTLAVWNTQNRAVTEKDYTKLGKTSSLIGTAGDIKAYGGEKVTGGERLGKTFLIATPANSGQYFFTEAEQVELLNYILKYNVKGITPVIQNPQYINAIMSYDYTFKNFVDDTASITTSLNQTIEDFFVSNFGSTIYIPALIEELNKNQYIESAYIKNRFKIIFDTLSALSGTYKIIPLLSTEITDFVNEDGTFFSGNVYGIPNAGTDSATLEFINVDNNYIVVKQISGVNNANFATFHKGSAYISTRKDIEKVNYEEITDEKYLYLDDTDGFSIYDPVISFNGTDLVGGDIQGINKKSQNIKHAWLQLDTIIGTDTLELTEGDYVTSNTNIIGEIIEVDDSNKKIFVKYTNGSDFAETQTLDKGIVHTTAEFNIVKRATLLLDTVTSLSVSDTVINSSGIVGTIEDITSLTITVRYADAGNFANGEGLDKGLTYSAPGTYTIDGSGFTLVCAGAGTAMYRMYLIDVAGDSLSFTVGTRIEPNNTWGFNTIASVSGTTGGTITVTDAVYNLSIGDTICGYNSSTLVSVSTTITNISGLVLTCADVSTFASNVAEVHEGDNWANVLVATIVKQDSSYNEEVMTGLELSSVTGLTAADIIKGPNGSAVLASFGSGNNIVLSSLVGSFEIGTNNFHTVALITDDFEPVYTLDGNVEDFTTNFVINTEEDENLPMFINKLDASDSGMVDAGTSSTRIGYGYYFNTTEKLDPGNLTLGLKYGTDAIEDLITEQNTKYLAVMRLDAAVSTLVIGDSVVNQKSEVAYVSDVYAEGAVPYIEIRYDTGTWAVADLLMKGTTYTSGTNTVVRVQGPDEPADILYVKSGGSSTDFLASINVKTGDIGVRRAETTNSGNITVIDYTSATKTITFADSSGFDASGTLTVWNNEKYEWYTWDYTANTGTVLQGTNSISEYIKIGMLSIQDTVKPLTRIEFEFKNKIDKLKLGNRALFYNSSDLINTF